MNRIPKLLSKTKLMRGYRCHKSLYLTIHQPELEAPITPDIQALFDQGNLVGAKAREYFPDGMLVDCLPWDFVGALAKTRELIDAGAHTIYEAAFEYLGCYARVDVIQYSPDTKRWRIYEVKSSTKVKPEHYDDIGLQAWILANSGLAIEKIYVMHLNPECRYPDLSQLFKPVDVTDEVREKYLTIRPTLAAVFAAIKQTDVPDIDIGAHCLAPTECSFKQHCWQQKKIPEVGMFNLPKIYSRKWELYKAGIITLEDAQRIELDEMQARVVKCHQSGERYIQPDVIRSALNEWKFPFVYLDFETINPAIPRYDGCRPFEQVPFQFSVHTQASLDANVTHQAYLHDALDDPRPALITALLNACGEHGSIIAYYGTFEAARIQALAEYSPQHHDALMKLIDRIVDPLPIIREAVYDNAFAGSFSLKRVAPALLGKEHSYDDMLVANGGDAQRAYEELISPSISAQRKQELKNAMLAYCEKDTYVMVELVRWLFGQV